MKKTHRRGFTLIELLVVVSIIALLVSILLPALADARRQAKGAVCQNNLKQTGISMLMYANEFNNNFPRIANGNWLFDVSYFTTDYVIATGGDKGVFYCPLEGVKNPDEDIFWRAFECWVKNRRVIGDHIPEPEGYMEEIVPGVKVDVRQKYFRVAGYFWLLGPMEHETDYFEKVLRPGPFFESPYRTWVTKATQRFSAETEFVVDITVSSGANHSIAANPDTAYFYDIEAGLMQWGVKDRTAHLGRDMKPRDGNGLYVDGHVHRKQFDEMMKRYLIWRKDLPYHWW